MRTDPPRSSQSIGENMADISRIQINVLGKFTLIRGKTPITEREWSTAKKPQMLLKALITRGAENVPMDMIIDDLWPESSLDEGRRKFKVVLHRLRKILGDPGGSLSYVFRETNRVSLNRELIRLDIDEFLALCRRAGKAEQAGDIKGAIDSGKSAIELYEGDYLEDEPYTPWIQQKREEIRELYLDELERTASLYERQGNTRKSIELYKILIKADPAREEAYRRLMQLYSGIGMRTEAIRVYNECKRALERELNFDPDELTTSLYERIAENRRSAGGIKSPELSRSSFSTPGKDADKLPASRGSLEGERKIVTVMFANVANFPAVFAELDAEDVYGIMDGCYRLLLHEVHRFEGMINEFLGKGVMALFGAPAAKEDHAQRACHAALAVQHSFGTYAEVLKARHGVELKMRIGLNSGPVVVGPIGNELQMDYTAQGDTVNLAQAMENAAEPGEVMVTERLYKLARRFFDFEPAGGGESKGREEFGAYRLTGSTGVETKFAASMARGLTRFIGRTQELKALREAFESAESGRGRVVGIVGEAGAGKSRLLHEFRNSMPKSRRWYFEGRCVHYGESAPYLPIRDVLRSFIGVREGESEHLIAEKLGEKVTSLDKDLGSILPPLRQLFSPELEDEAFGRLEPERKSKKTFEAIHDLLIRASRRWPIVLAIEDFHRVDGATEQLLEQMIDWVQGSRILLILLYRTEYASPWQGKSCYREIKLGRLSGCKSAELLSAIPGGDDAAPELREIILGRAEGNPFFLEELTLAMLENGSTLKNDESFMQNGDASGMKVPDTIEGVLAARMDRLEESLKRILQVAAVIGRAFSLRTLENVWEVKDGLKAGLLELQRLELICTRGLSPEREYIFRHALTRDVAYNSLLVQRRREIHELVGKAIEELYPQRLEEFYDILAWHYSRSDNQEKACQYLRPSGLKT